MKGVPLKLGIMCTIAPEPIVDLISELRRQREGIEFQLSDANAWDLQSSCCTVIRGRDHCIPGQEPDVCLTSCHSSGSRSWPRCLASIGLPLETQ